MRTPAASAPPLQHPLFAGLDGDTLALLRGSFHEHRFAPGEVIVHEGEPGDSLYLITAGSVEVRKQTGGLEQALAVNTIGPGEVLGELSFLGGDARSSTLVALAPTTAWSLARGRLHAQGPAGDAAAAWLDARVAHVLAARLRRSTQHHADALEQRLAELQARREFGQLFVATVAVVAMSILVALAVRAYWPGLDPHAAWLNWALLLLLAVPMVAMVRVSRRPLADFGLTLAGGRRAALEGWGWGVAGVLLMAAALHLASPTGLTLHWDDSFYGYPLHAALQEFVSRGVIQGSLQRFLDDRRGWVSVLLSALLFGLAHMIYGLEAIAVTLVSGVAFGLLYRRHGNLIGVTVLHAVVGLAAFVFRLI